MYISYYSYIYISYISYIHICSIQYHTYIIIYIHMYHKYQYISYMYIYIYIMDGWISSQVISAGRWVIPESSLPCSWQWMSTRPEADILRTPGLVNHRKTIGKWRFTRPGNDSQFAIEHGYSGFSSWIYPLNMAIYS